MAAGSIDLNEERPPPVLTPQWETQHGPRNEREEENSEDELMQPKSPKVKAELMSPAKADGHAHTDPEQVMRSHSTLKSHDIVSDITSTRCFSCLP